MTKDISLEEGNSLRVLAHICCGPCSIYPLKGLLKGRAGSTPDVWGFFYNPNIHPYSEFKKRLEAAKTLSKHLSLNVIFHEKYEPSVFVRGMKAERELSSSRAPGVRYPANGERCLYCYANRLEKTAQAAVEFGFTYFTTSLLYSKYQMHDEIKKTGIDLAAKYGIIFHYEDYRRGWAQGIEESRALGLYRQNYCGCIYSKLERNVEKRLKKQVIT
ncbi:MAG: epoxyqueuosine reductase QueH [Deltaproteobacteria bacterium]|nr:epoxyqueuosine reductase QueH [Deltaproteobacteria bacterium]